MVLQCLSVPSLSATARERMSSFVCCFDSSIFERLNCLLPRQSCLGRIGSLVLGLFFPGPKLVFLTFSLGGSTAFSSMVLCYPDSSLLSCFRGSFRVL